MSIASWALLALGAGVIVWALFVRGRAKGKRRCPKCWYDMSATDGMTCPECGRTQKREKTFGKRRRSWKLASLGVLLLLASYGASVTPDVKRGGWMWAVPRWALVVMAPMVETPTQTELDSYLVSIGWKTTPAPGSAPGGKITIPKRLWCHLFIRRLGNDQLTQLEYVLIRDYAIRKLREGALPKFALAGFTRSAREKLMVDETYMSFVIPRSLSEHSRSSKSVIFVYRGQAFETPPCNVTLNGAEVQTAWTDEFGRSSTMTSAPVYSPSIGGKPEPAEPVVVATSGPNRGVVRIVVTPPTVYPESDRPEDPVRHEFTITLDDDRLKGG